MNTIKRWAITIAILIIGVIGGLIVIGEMREEDTMLRIVITKLLGFALVYVACKLYSIAERKGNLVEVEDLDEE